jgi:type IV secretion system protein VirB4
MDGRPTLLLLDEAWQMLSHPVFAEKLREWLKTWRKANGAVVMAT